MKVHTISLLILIATLMNACAPVAADSTENPTVTTTDLPIPTQAATETLLPVQPLATPLSMSKAWREFRDSKYGFGLALPCWWWIIPIPPGEGSGAMTVHNYDQAYFDANSTKGSWDWPNGAMKLDIYVTEGADPAKSDSDAYMAFVDTSLDELVSTEVRKTGGHTATVLTLGNVINTNTPDFKTFVYRLAPDKLLSVAPTPQSIIDTSEFQAILSSIVLAPEEQIVLPSIEPAPALIDASCAQ